MKSEKIVSNMRKQLHKPKYNIRERLDQLPYSQRRHMMEQIIKACGKSKGQFYRWMALEGNSKSEIPANALLIISHILGCRPHELYNTPPIPFMESNIGTP